MSERGLPPVIGRYRPLGVLGAGGMGVVYKAHDPVIGRMVAIKLVRTDTLDAATRMAYMDRFRIEAQAAGRCMHPAIVAVYDVVTADNDPCIVMEYVEGRPLNQLLRERAGVGIPSGIAATAAMAVPILLQVLDGLGYAHRLGVTHRDIKPANIIVTASGTAKIADFGIARLSEISHASMSLTQAGDMLGTPSYMAPEQLSETDVDHRADLFAVGAVLYEALAGRPPFAGRNMVETIQRLSGSKPASMVAVEAAGAGAFVSVLQRALAKPRSQRFQSAEEFAQALQAAGAQAPPPARTQDDDQATVLWPPVTHGTQAPPARTFATQAGATQTGRWDSGTLLRMERALANYVGPIARVMVAQAAQQATTPDELYQTLARSLQSTADRSAFLRSLGGPRVEPRLDNPTLGPAPAHAANTQAGNAQSGTMQPGATQPGTTQAGGGRIAGDAVAAAQAALAFFVGPIAQMLVRQAAAKAVSPQDFIERVCAHVTKPNEVMALRRRLRAEVEPRLR